MSALQAQALYKSYRSGAINTAVLRGLSIELQAGALSLISGPSGCGKSTLLALLSGLAHPDSGSVSIFGENLANMSRKALTAFRLQHVGFVFQGFHLFPALRAWEQVALCLGYMGMSASRARDESHAALAAVGLSERTQLRPNELSGGEKQRVAVARALAKRPQLIFADEPSSALDAASGKLVIDCLHQTARNNGTLVLCVSHDFRLIRAADRVLNMQDGVLSAYAGSSDSFGVSP